MYLVSLDPADPYPKFLKTRSVLSAHQSRVTASGPVQFEKKITVERNELFHVTQHFALVFFIRVVGCRIHIMSYNI